MHPTSASFAFQIVWIYAAWAEHPDEVLVLHAASNELLFGHLAVTIDVQLGEDPIGSLVVSLSTRRCHTLHN